NARGGVLNRQQHVVADRVLHVLVQAADLRGIFGRQWLLDPHDPRGRRRLAHATSVVLPLTRRAPPRGRRTRLLRAARSRTTRGPGAAATACTARRAATGCPPCGRSPPRRPARAAAA